MIVALMSHGLYNSSASYTDPLSLGFGPLGLEWGCRCYKGREGKPLCMLAVMYVCMHICEYACMYVNICLYVSMYVSMYVDMYVCMYVRQGLTMRLRLVWNSPHASASHVL